MYHGRFKKSHYEAGYNWGRLLYNHGKIISNNHTFTITQERKEFAEKCLPIYKKYYPEVLEEIKGLADGQNCSCEDFYTFLLSMYCFEFNNHCTCIAVNDKNSIFFGRNSDFLVSLEKLYMNCLYNLDNVYAFNGNTTAFIEMEDGINEYGLAVGLTFNYPTVIKPGFNADMPFIDSSTPFYLMRINRKIWILGQCVYVIMATFIYLVFILISTSLVCMTQSFVGNMWSETAAILGYSGIGQDVALPALVKTLEMSRPYECMLTIFALMLLYTLVMALIMLLMNLKKRYMGGVISVFAFSLYGFLLNPETIRNIFHLPDPLMYKANVAVGWLSPLNHATYHMHNFGYDLLPKLWQTYLIFGILIILIFFLLLRAARHYSFNFLGTEG